MATQWIIRSKAVASVGEAGYTPAMQLQTLADINPNGTPTRLSATPGTLATWANAVATGTSIRIGDALVGASRGQLLTTGVLSQVLIRGDFAQQPYDLYEVYAYGASGTDKVSISYGV